MESVRLAISQAAGDTAHRNLRGSATSTADLPGASWVKFGDAIAYYGNASDWPHVSEAAGRASFPLRDHPHEIDPKHLHVVIQKGNLFQRKHAEIPVILDKGRFLLVEMHPEQAQRLSGRHAPCYSIHPLEAMEAADPRGKNRIVFTAHSGAGIRASARAADPAVRELVSRLSRTTFEADLTKLTQFPTRNSTTTHFKNACNFAKEQFVTMGYATRLQDIAVNGASSANVVAERVGAGARPRRLVLVTAHLDSINGHAGGDSAAVAPGADDDGSGSAGVLEIARALRDHHGKNDLQFVLFGGEEEGLLGSDEFVRSMNATDRARVQAVVQMDMIGSLNTAMPTVLLEGASLSQPLIDGLAAAAATYTSLAVQTSLIPADSDHVSFLEKGIAAVLTIEGADRSNHVIHTANDTLDLINFDLALEILRMNTAFVVEALRA